MNFRLLPSVGFAITALFCTTAAAWPGPGPDWHGPWWPPGPFASVVVITPISPDFFPPPAPPHPEVAAPQPSIWVEKSQTFQYYCPDPAGYYPKVSRCPKGWMKVVASN